MHCAIMLARFQQCKPSRAFFVPRINFLLLLNISETYSSWNLIMGIRGVASVSHLPCCPSSFADFAGHCYLMMDDLQQAYSAYQQALYHLQDPKVRSFLRTGFYRCIY